MKPPTTFDVEEEISDRRDPVAHFKHTFRVAEEQVEEISEIEVPDARTGATVRRFVFEGEQFATRDEAEAARQQSIVAKARHPLRVGHREAVHDARLPFVAIENRAKCPQAEQLVAGPH